MRYCPRCGSPCADTDILCRNCGYILGAVERPPFPSGYGVPVNRSATASLVCGILGLLTILRPVGLVFAAAAVVLGIHALWAIRRSHGFQCGRGRAVAGIVTGVVPLALLALTLILMWRRVAVPMPSGPADRYFPFAGGQSGIPT